MWAFIKRNAKAIIAGAGAFLGFLYGAVTGDETLADVTTNEWLGAVLAVLAVYGATWRVPNDYDA